jgi:hypothetical protein
MDTEEMGEGGKMMHGIIASYAAKGTREHAVHQDTVKGLYRKVELCPVARPDAQKKRLHRSYTEHWFPRGVGIYQID